MEGKPNPELKKLYGCFLKSWGIRLNDIEGGILVPVGMVRN
jgi:hypothetical protein